MKKTNTGPFKNNLAAIRQRNHISQNRLAELIGDKTIDRLRQYERGVKTPNLKTALKLAYIFDLPVRVMLDGYFAACREEVKRDEFRLVHGRRNPQAFPRKTAAADFCTHELRLGDPHASERTVEQARRHISELVRKTAEMLGHV